VLGQPLTVIALDLDHLALEGAARTAQALHLGDPGLEGGARLGQSADHGHRLAVASTAVAEEPHHAVVGRRRAAAGWSVVRTRLHRLNVAELASSESLYARGTVVSPARGREGVS